MDEKESTLRGPECGHRIAQAKSEILNAWEARVRRCIPAAQALDSNSLRNSLPRFLDQLAESFSKLSNVSPAQRLQEKELAREHGAERSSQPVYDLSQMIEEYQVLRQVIFDVLRAQGDLTEKEQDVILDAITVGIRNAVAEYQLQTENRFRIVVEGVKDHAIILTDVDGNVLEWNTGAANVTGFTKEDMIGKKGSLIFTPEDLANGVHLQEMKTARENGRAEDNRWHIRKDGTRFFATGAMNPVLMHDGTLMGYIKVLRDATEIMKTEQSLRESELRFRELANGLPVIVWTARPDGFVDWYNDWWQRYLATPDRTTWDDPENLVMHPDDIEKTKEVWYKIVQAGEEFIFEQRFRRGCDGQYRWHAVRGAPIRNAEGQITKYVGANTDIHEQKVLEEELKESRLAAEAASQTKSSFLANMSHEIRTPMTAVLGFTEVLRDPDLTEEEKRDAIDRIDTSGRSLLRIIDDVLDISKIEAGKLAIHKSRYSPLAMASDVVSMLRLSAEQKGVQLRIKSVGEIPSSVHCDPARFRQILMNLVGNAVKFTSNGEVTITFRSEGSSTLIVQVRDTGIGIAESDQSKLFQPFAQADESISRKFGGTGLGLLLSRRLAEQLGGSLELVESHPGRGSCFEVKVYGAPFEYGESNHEKPVSRTTDFIENLPLEGVSVLLAEDVADNQVLMKRYLVSAGAEVHLVSDGAQAMKEATGRKFDLILMDIQMPKVDGIQATRQLRKLGYPGIIVALTAHAMPEEVKRSLDAGFDAHLTKPITRDKLVSEVHSLVGGR